MRVVSGEGIEGLAQALGAMAGRQGHELKIAPAKMVHVRGILEAADQPKFEVGDIVKLREHAEEKFRYPKRGEHCIVTQSLDKPYRNGEPGSKHCADRNDIALAFVDESDGEIFENLYDSRHFVKVGSIYDPIDVGGQQVPVV